MAVLTDCVALWATHYLTLLSSVATYCPLAFFPNCVLCLVSFTVVKSLIYFSRDFANGPTPCILCVDQQLCVSGRVQNIFFKYNCSTALIFWQILFLLSIV